MFGRGRMLRYIFLLTHGNWGAELVKSAELILGKIDDVYCFSLEESTSTKVYETEIEKKVNELGEKDILLISDLFGGAPYVIGAKISYRHGLQMINGLGMELFTSVCLMRDAGTLQENIKEMILKSREKIALLDLDKILRFKKGSNDR
jgi:mannose/fructose-specific phosphotransferase system component IIA